MTIALDWPTQLIPIWSDDLADYVAAIATMWSEVEVYQADPDNDVAAWQALFDVDVAPMQALPWLAQCVGERLPVGIDESGARDWIRQAPNWSRGTYEGIVAAVTRVLDPDATVYVEQRQQSDGTVDVDYIYVFTFSAQTPDPQRVRNQLRRTVPADIVWEYELAAPKTWAAVQVGMANWTQFEATHGPTWADVTKP